MAHQQGIVGRFGVIDPEMDLASTSSDSSSATRQQVPITRLLGNTYGSSINGNAENSWVPDVVTAEDTTSTVSSNEGDFVPLFGEAPIVSPLLGSPQNPNVLEMRIVKTGYLWLSEPGSGGTTRKWVALCKNGLTQQAELHVFPKKRSKSSLACWPLTSESVAVLPQAGDNRKPFKFWLDIRADSVHRQHDGSSQQNSASASNSTPQSPPQQQLQSFSATDSFLDFPRLSRAIEITCLTQEERSSWMRALEATIVTIPESPSTLGLPVVLQMAFVRVTEPQSTTIISSLPVMVKIRAGARIQLVLVLHVFRLFQGGSILESVENATGRTDYSTSLADLAPRDRPYVICLRERAVSYNPLTKIRVETSLLDSERLPLCMLRFEYLVKLLVM